MALMRVAGLALGVAIVLGALGANASASECVVIKVPGAKPPTFRQFKAQFDLIFTGTVIRGMPNSAETMFQVDRVWKGKIKRETTLLIPDLTGFGPRAGRTYLMFLERCRVGCTGWEPIYDAVGPCGWGQYEISDDRAQPLLKQLGPGTPPRD
jgi:hypothetical protein